MVSMARTALLLIGRRSGQFSSLLRSHSAATTLLLLSYSAATRQVPVPTINPARVFDFQRLRLMLKISGGLSGCYKLKITVSGASAR